MASPAICLVSALPAEGRPVKNHLALRRDQQATEFPLYRSGHISLVISGVGGRAAEKAVHWLAARQQKAINPIWVNLGIAGHPTRPLGQAVLAAEIEDDANGHPDQQYGRMVRSAHRCVLHPRRRFAA